MHPTIIVEHQPDVEKLEILSVDTWPIWEKEVSTFDWFYDSEEVCYLLSGRVRIHTETHPPLEIATGDLVVFPRGLSCQWEILEPVKKHYQFR